MKGKLYLEELKKIIKDKEVIYEYIDMTLNEHPNNSIKNFKFIRKVSKPLTQQIGGKIQNVTLGDKEFIVDMTVQQAEKGDDYYSIYYFNMDIESFKCGIIEINKRTNEAFIVGLSNFEACIMCKDKNYKYKKGDHKGSNFCTKISDILMKIILNLCVKKNVKSIKLTDNTKIDCKGLNDKFELIIFRTMTHGEPYYIKFGFLPENKTDIETYNQNKKLHKTVTIDFNKIQQILNKINDKNNTNEIQQIMELINMKPHTKLFAFVNYMYKHHPIILKDIYAELYSVFGYKQYRSKVFIKKL